jgi:hypothetical protein
MLLQFLLIVFTYLLVGARAHPMVSVFERQNPETSSNESHSMSVEALVGVIAIAVAILGIVFPLIWPSFKARLDSRRRRSRFRLNSTTCSTFFSPV